MSMKRPAEFRIGSETMMIHIESIFFEDAPWQYALSDEAFLDSRAKDLPLPFRKRLGEIHANVDGTRCWDCRCVVGFYLSSENGPGRIDWYPLELCRQDEGPVAILCEGCAIRDLSGLEDPNRK